MRQIAFWCAISSYVLFIPLVIYSAAIYPGYDHASRFISELGASGAPTETLIRFGTFLPAGILLMLFSLAAAKVLPRSTLATFGFGLLAYNGFGMMAAAFFPCDVGCRPESPSASQIIHNLLGLGGYLAAVLGLMVLGVQARHWQGLSHLFPLGLGCGILGFLSLLFIDPGFYYAGVAQRLLEICVAAWTLSCAWGIRKYRLPLQIADFET